MRPRTDSKQLQFCSKCEEFESTDAQSNSGLEEGGERRESTEEIGRESTEEVAEGFQVKESVSVRQQLVQYFRVEAAVE